MDSVPLIAENDSDQVDRQWPVIEVDSDEGAAICRKMSQLTDVANSALALLCSSTRRPNYESDVHNTETDAWENLRAALAAAGYSWEELP